MKDDELEKACEESYEAFEIDESDRNIFRVLRDKDKILEIDRLEFERERIGLEIGELTSKIIEAEKNGDFETANKLEIEKDRLFELRRTLWI